MPALRRSAGLLAAATVLLAACGSSTQKAATPRTPVSTSTTTASPTSSTTATGTSPSTTTGQPPAATTSVTVTVPAGNGAAPLDTPRTLDAPAGTTIEAWARVTGARFETWTPEGDLLVSVPSKGEIMDLHPAPDPTAPPTITPLVSGLDQPQGMAFDGQQLFVAEADRLDAYAWKGSGVGDRQTVAELPGPPEIGDYEHPLKNVVIGPDHTLDVDVASTGNIAVDDRSAQPQRAVVESFAEAGGSPTILARGVRNGDGLAWSPDGQLWVAVNERDNVADPSTGQVDQTYVNDHPPDELAAIGDDRDLGWPLCDPSLGAGVDPYGAMALTPDVQTNAGGRKLDCSGLAPIERGLHAHSAPLGLTFLEGSAVPAPWRAGAVVGTHGSNDHVPALAGAVVWLPWEGRTLGPEQNLLSGWITASGDRWGRPVDIVAGPGGALYVSDDTAGVIYRVVLPTA